MLTLNSNRKRLVWSIVGIPLTGVCIAAIKTGVCSTCQFLQCPCFTKETAGFIENGILTAITAFNKDLNAGWGRLRN